MHLFHYEQKHNNISIQLVKHLALRHFCATIYQSLHIYNLRKVRSRRDSLSDSVTGNSSCFDIEKPQYIPGNLKILLVESWLKITIGLGFGKIILGTIIIN